MANKKFTVKNNLETQSLILNGNQPNTAGGILVLDANGKMPAVDGSNLTGLSSSSVTPGEQVYTTAGTYSWICPANVTSVCVVCVGGGGGDSYFINATTVKGGTGAGGTGLSSGGTYVGDGGGNGGGTGTATNTNGYVSGEGGGGAGGYSGNGGKGGNGTYSTGAGQHCRGGAGGGVGLYGQGANGVGTSFGSYGTTGGNGVGGGGGGGSGGDNASGGNAGMCGTGGSGGLPTISSQNMSATGYGAGAGGLSSGAISGGGLGWKNNISVTPGTSYTVVVGATRSVTNSGTSGSGAVRIIWGTGRSFPNNAS